MLQDFKGLREEEITQINYTNDLERKLLKQAKTDKMLEGKNAQLEEENKELKLGMEDLRVKAVEKENKLKREIQSLKTVASRLSASKDKNENILPEPRPVPNSRAVTQELKEKPKVVSEVASLKLANKSL